MSSTTEQGALASLLQHLDSQQNGAPPDRRGLSKELAELQERLRTNPSLEADPRFKTEVAWLLQDWARHGGAGQQPWLPPAMAGEFRLLATTAPGLQNEELRGMLAQTGDLPDRGLVRSIRQEALRVGGMSTEEQMSFAVGKMIGALEFRIGASLAAAEPSLAPAPQVPEPPVPPSPVRPPPALEPEEERPVPTPRPTVHEADEPSPTPRREPLQRSEPEPAVPVEPVATVEPETGARPDARQASQPTPTAGETWESPVLPPMSAGRGGSAEPTAGPSPSSIDVQQRRDDQESARRSERAVPDNTPARPAKAQDNPVQSGRTTQEDPAPVAPVRQSHPSQVPGMMTAAGSKLASWGAEFMGKRGKERVHELAQKVTDAVRDAENDLRTVELEGAGFFEKLDRAAMAAGRSRTELIAEMAPGGPQQELRAEFDKAMQANPKLKAAHTSAIANLRTVQRKYSHLNMEAEGRSMDQAPEILSAYEGIEGVGKKAAAVPGEVPGRNLLQEAGAVIEALVKRVIDFLAQRRQREEQQETAPSRGM